MRYFKSVIVIIFIVIFLSGDILWGAPSESQISEIYTAVSGGNPPNIDGTKATFSDGVHIWTIFGAVQDKGDLYNRPTNWSVSGEYDVKIVEEAVSDTMILPFSEPVPNVNSSKSITLKTCRGEYEPASFVLRSGTSKLTNVTITVSDLMLQGSAAKIDSVNVDIRIVKCWFQAGVSIDRRRDNKKRLISELLLHDNDLVKVDYENQVNLVRDISTKTNFFDSESLVPFEVPEKFNQQIWLTFKIPADATSGKYYGNISVKFTSNSKQYKKVIPVTVVVNKFDLLPPPIECALFYLARYIPASANYLSLGARGKTAAQMLAEFQDMKAHGLTNVAIDHEYKLDGTGKPDLSKLSPVLDLYREAGFSSKRFLYVDWNVTYYNNTTRYKEKLSSIFSLGQKKGFNEFYVYGKDEASYDELLSYRDAFNKVHQSGGKNFMACNRNVAILMREVIDVAILPRDTSLENFNTPDENLIINGDMSVGLEDAGAGWISTNRAFLDIENGKVNKLSGEYGYLVQQLPFEKGKSYLLEYDIGSLVKTTGFILAAGGGSCVASDILLATQPGKNSVIFTSDADGSSLRFAFGSADQFELDNVVLKESSAVSIGAQIVPWAYNGPQAGKEVPGTYQDRFGVSLLEDGYRGECNYAYQSGDCWNDWADDTWRPHVMAYPTAVKPIPTLQWEGWREGIDAMRYNVTQVSLPLSNPKNLRVK
ncbi:MAG: hypothetical protein AVO38_08045 [delta proteobacterium ML8_D]|nr:MAG: hypothetical protein AVO38_08045 [delta proteobacterium ML8_D]